MHSLQINAAAYLTSFTHDYPLFAENEQRNTSRFTVRGIRLLLTPTASQDKPDWLSQATPDAVEGQATRLAARFRTGQPGFRPHVRKSSP